LGQIGGQDFDIPAKAEPQVIQPVRLRAQQKITHMCIQIVCFFVSKNTPGDRRRSPFPETNAC
jgi:hypothetical protein